VTARLGTAGIAPLALAVLAAALVGSQIPERPMLTAAAVVGPLVVAFAFLRLEVAYGLLVFAALIAPVAVGYDLWLLVLVLVVGVGAAHALAENALVVPAAFVAYFGVYLLALVHGDLAAFDLTETGKYLFFPLLALTTASIATRPDLRFKLVAMIVVAGLAQIPAAVFQSAKVAVTMSANRLWGVDTVTGLVQSRGAGALALVGVAVATLCLALSLERVWRPRLLLGAAVALTFVGVLSGSRGVYVFVPAAFLPMLLGYVVFGRRPAASGRVVALLGLSVVLLPALVVAQGLLYPGANTHLRSAESVKSLLSDTGPSSGTLPNRGAQLRIAVDQSLGRGVDGALLGAGLGTTRFGADATFETPKSDPLVIGIEQRTNGVWVPRLISEAGYIGVAAFLGLLAFLVAVARRGYRRTAPGTLDRALFVALPGFVGLTFVGALYNTALAVQPYATILWIVVGLCLAALRAPRPRGPAAP
jgi:hypothetical protein